MKPIILLSCLLFAGCATPQRVYVPTPTHCDVTLPPDPPHPEDGLATAPDLLTQFKLAMAGLLVWKQMDAEAVAGLAKCK